MIENLKSDDLRKIHPEYEVKTVKTGFLLTPLHNKIFPREPLIIDRKLYTDDNGNILNGITPIDLSADSLAEIVANIIADLRDQEINLNGKPRSLLFLRLELIDGKEYFHVTQPGSATHFYLITSWNRDNEQIGSGVSRAYATDHGAVRFCKHRPKFKKSGRDFWILPTKFLSNAVVTHFDQAWQTAVHQAIDAHARRYPKDNSVNSHRQRITQSGKRHGA